MVLSVLVSGVNAQLLNVKKDDLDSMRPSSRVGSASFGLNFNQDNEKSLFFLLDGSGIRTSFKHSYEGIFSSFFNGIEKNSNARRNHALMRVNLWKFKPGIRRNPTSTGSEKKYVGIHEERRFNPELFFFFQNDENRGIRTRNQIGINGVYNFKGKKWLRFNAGLGILAEREKWRLFENEHIDYFNNLDPDIQQKIKDYFGMDNNFNVPRDNLRANLFLNAFLQPGNVFSLNFYGALQPPFKPPYRSLPPSSIFLDLNKRYPRYTIEAVMAFKISKKFSLNTRLYMQHDRGQIAPFAPDEIWNVSQGIAFKW
jgi:hypothetical protein